MSDMMTFPATVEEFMEQYKIVDDEKVYTNGADLVPIFRMMQWFEHVSATNINVGDMINRQQAIDAMCLACGHDCDKSKFVYNAPQDEQVIMCPEHYALSTMPSAQPEQRLDEWCTNCKEYDNENHCCPRWTNVIRQTRRELQDEFVMTAVDGTLWVTVDDVQKVGRVIVDEEKSKFCKTFYGDGQVEQKWIPVSDKLPDEKGEYLVTYHPCYWDNVYDEIKVGFDTFRGKTKWAKKKHQRVIAWKPIDEPYKPIM